MLSKINKKYILILIGGFLFYLFIFSKIGILEQIRLQKKKVELEKKIKKLQEENQRLKEEIERLKRDKGYIKKLSHNLGLKEKGEKIIFFVKSNRKSSQNLSSREKRGNFYYEFLIVITVAFLIFFLGILIRGKRKNEQKG